MTASVAMADEASRQLGARFVVLGPSLGAEQNLLIARESGQGSLDIPARLAEPRAMLGPPFRELWFDARGVGVDSEATRNQSRDLLGRCLDLRWFLLNLRYPISSYLGTSLTATGYTAL